MNDRITIIGGVLTINGRRATDAESDRISVMVKIKALVEMNYGGMTWFEKARVAIEAKPSPPKDPNRVETRGRPRKNSFHKKDITLNLVKELKLCMLSGAEVARELERRGYGKVSKDYANRKLREAGVLLELQQRGGRPRKGE